MDLRQSKRYSLKAAVKFSWENSNGSTMRGEGFTRDISATGVFVVTSAPLPTEGVVKLEVSLPSLRAQQKPGACLRTLGHVVRSETLGFAAAADMGFSMQLSETGLSQWSIDKANGGTKHESRGEEKRVLHFFPLSRFQA